METAFIFLAAFYSFRLQPIGAANRNYYIAAVEIGWDYTHLENANPGVNHKKLYKDAIQKYIKAVYREYTDSTYTVLKPRPAWSGIQGPVIVAQAGDRVVVHFKNMASQPYSISPVGVTYWKQSEGAGYEDSTAGQEKEDDAVSPGGYYEYVWDISIRDGPTQSDPECLTYSYSSRVDTVRDMNSGLIGSLLICKPNAFTEDEERKNPAFVLMFAVFDESQSWYGEVGERRSRERFRKSNIRKEYHTVNGYINSTLPGLTLCYGRGNVFWHLIGVGTAPDIHSIQFHDHTLQVLSHRKVTVEITPMTFITAEMKPTSVGHFPITCNIVAHRHAGMSALFTVEKCPEVVLHQQRNANYDDYHDDDDKDIFNVISIEPKKPKVQARASGTQVPKTWQHFIAAEEIIWNYAPHLKHSDSELQSPYLPKVPHHLDYKYKKVVYVEYSDESFTKRLSPPNTLLGPLLKGKVNDQFSITFKNLASRPFNIYPNGLTKVYPLEKNTNEAKRDLRTMGVPPNSTFRYIWKLTTEDGPLNGDPQCLTQLYQSTVSPERDLATGLVGTLLICKYHAIDISGRLLSPDRELSLIFAVFDENRSWCFEENMIKSKQLTLFNNTDSVNGIMFSGRKFVMCQTDVTFWHIANVGTQSNFLSIYFTGNLFEYQDAYQSVLTLFPMTATTVSMETEINGEWEISAFDSSRKSRGMSILYSVRPCDTGKTTFFDNDEEEYVFDYLDSTDFGPRGSRPLNGTITVRVCKKGLNVTQFETTGSNKTLRCKLKNVTLAQLSDLTARKEKEEEIPLDVLEESSVHTGSENPNVRLKRQAHGNWTENNLMSEELTGYWELDAGDLESQNVSTALKENNQILSDMNMTMYDPESSNEILLDPMESVKSEGANLLKKLLNYPPTNLEKQTADFGLEFRNNTDIENATHISLSVDYDDYSLEENGTDTFGSDYLNMRSGEMRGRHYYIAAEEISWDYGISKPYQFIKHREMRRGMRKFLPKYKKVVYRAYRDKDFQHPVPRGELEEHLGIMGPFIRAEVNELLTVVFKNKASRPYSFHIQGVYDRSQRAGSGQTYTPDAPPGVPGDPVAPGEARTYTWRVTKKEGPSDKELSCKTGAYYSTQDKDRDLHSGLVGPLVICKPGILQPGQKDVQEFALLFHSFDETKSWYLEENLQEYCVPPCRANREEPGFHTSNSFAAINGYVAETLPGLLVAQHQLVRWHLLNVGSDGEYHAVHFHSLPFIVHTGADHRMGVYQLFPGVFGTLEMRPPTVGTWLVECTVADYQLAGMRAKVLVYNPKCVLPLGMKSGRIDDFQITASNYLDGWEPRLARLDQSGFVNAWMGQGKMPWIQVDLLRPMLLHGVQTQGVRAKLRDHYITHFSVSYSMDLETWTNYRGNSTRRACLFFGNMDSAKVKENTFSPPFVARYIRIHPVNVVKRPALRMELLGCDVNSCSLPLGLQARLIPDTSFTASSVHSSLLWSWSPFLARLHQEGSANAWRPKNNNPHEWLQVDLGKVRRIAGVVTQGAYSLLTQMMVTEFSVSVSQDGHSWSSVLEEGSQRDKIFSRNNDPDDEALTVFDYPLFGRYLRIHPLGWINDIALRLEVLGCDTQQLPL
ncbi:coagulation factor VIII isoform X2 [Boleophthalmus pectinirostris]|uniref:coagulation factor VIII isoform X2 n=1 Tax=Boleophthalmus pectinirostris TaxID=150288 RepID=UPI002431B6ED|nr:coagulation factor VIII isoform X2 [Boleophthalmus pectinirostris]